MGVNGWQSGPDVISLFKIILSKLLMWVERLVEMWWKGG